MDSAGLNEEDYCEEPYSALSFSSELLMNEVICKDPEIFPRVGDDFQAKIPPLMPKADYISLAENPTRLNQLSYMEVMRSKHESCKVLEVSNDSQHEIASSQSERKIEDINQCFKVENSDVTWSDTEEAVFLLGVYLFGKHFDQVKRFMECKKMEDILSFYYGKFYGSSTYHDWKTKCKRRVFGMKIFTGLRQKELLSRLLPRISEDSHDNMLEVSKTFGEGNISLEEYVSTLKSIVGMNNLIEAVGIGTEKQDLTRITRKSLRSSQGLHVRAKMPADIVCSTLSLDDIIKFLTGDFRLSKAQSNDLFWEAVWPRLLARGWHSEQPNDRSYTNGFKYCCLVFLMPGVHKFSRKELVKGDHYFDSITDVLKKVASEPALLELNREADEEIDESKEECHLTNDEKLGHDDSSVMQRHWYLQPKKLKHSPDFAKITVVDTSLGAHGEISKVRKMRCLEEVESNTDMDIDPQTKIGLMVMYPCTSLPDNGLMGRDSIVMTPVFKRRRRLSACGRTEAKNGSNGTLLSPQLEKDDAHGCLDNITELVEQSQKKLPSTKFEGLIMHHDCLDFEHSQPRKLTDLNIVVERDDIEKQENQARKCQDDNMNAQENHASVASSSEQCSYMRGRRQSTRNRPLTIKALEAIANE